MPRARCFPISSPSGTDRRATSVDTPCVSAPLASTVYTVATTVAQPASTAAAAGKCELPAQISGFKLYGCAVSAAGFAGLAKIATSQAMTLEACASSCGKTFFGVYSR